LHVSPATPTPKFFNTPKNPQTRRQANKFFIFIEKRVNPTPTRTQNPQTAVWPIFLHQKHRQAKTEFNSLIRKQSTLKNHLFKPLRIVSFPQTVPFPTISAPILPQIP
jgi:hypothetical protein